MSFLVATTLAVLVLGVFIARRYYQARQRRIHLEEKRRLNHTTDMKATGA